MALGEHRHGAGRGAQFLLGMVVSTGVGGGLVLDGAPYDGASGNAGHVGHVVVDLDGPPCACGGHGCVEAIASGPRMVRWARDHGWAAPADAGAKELAQAADAGNELAVLAFRRSATALAAMIASVAAVCDLDLAVIGGGVANAGSLLFDPLREALGGYARLDFLRELSGGARAARRRRGPGRCGRSRRRAFWLIDGGCANLERLHRRPSVTEKSVEGPGDDPGGPRRRTRPCAPRPSASGRLSSPDLSFPDFFRPGPGDLLRGNRYPPEEA